MRFAGYSFACILEDAAILPEYKGSTFRGIFGHALKQVVCALKRQECDECILRQKCLYASVIEPKSWNQLEAKKPKTAMPPHPYVIEPDPDQRTSFAKGELFGFNLILFGEVNDSLPYFIYAFDQVGRRGIGKKVEGQRARFALERVEVEGSSCYSKEHRKILNMGNQRDLSLENLTRASDHGVHTVNISLLTPLRIKHQNHLEASLPFHVLVRAMLRRVSTLLAAYGAGEPDLDYQGLTKRAQTVETIESHLSWFDWRRYSNRQDQAMLMGGIVGNVSYTGDLGEFLPLIRFCEISHLGKQTTFGLGKIKMEAIP